MRHPTFSHAYLFRSRAAGTLYVLLLLLPLLARATMAADSNPPCEPAGGFTPICGVVAPEDLLHTREPRVEPLFAGNTRDIDPTPVFSRWPDLSIRRRTR